MELDWSNLLDKVYEFRTPIHGIFGYLKLILDDEVDDESERCEYLQQAHQTALHVVGLAHEFPSIDTIFPSTDQLSHEERQKLERLISEFCRGTDALAELVSGAIEEIEADATNLAPIQEALNQALFELNLLNDLVDQSRNKDIDVETKRDRFLQQIQQLTVYLLQKTNALSNIELMISSNPQLDTNEQAILISQCKEFRTDIEGVVETMSAALEAIAFNPEQLQLLQEKPYNLVSSLFDRNQELLVSLGQFREAFVIHHFSTLRTQIRDLQILKLSLEQLGLTVALDTDVRGWNGQKAKADVVGSMSPL